MLRFRAAAPSPKWGSGCGLPAVSTRGTDTHILGGSKVLRWPDRRTCALTNEGMGCLGGGKATRWNCSVEKTQPSAGHVFEEGPVWGWRPGPLGLSPLERGVRSWKRLKIFFFLSKQQCNSDSITYLKKSAHTIIFTCIVPPVLHVVKDSFMDG